jgi:hypothetical protein
MALLAFNGCETLEPKSGWTHSAGITVTAAGRTANGLVLNGTPITIDYGVPVSSSRMIIGFGIKLATNSNIAAQWLRIFTSSNNEYTINADSGGSTIVFRTGGAANSITASSSGSIGFGEWHYIEVDFQTGAGGHCRIWLDDVQVLNHSATLGSGNITALSHRCSSNNHSFAIDDIYVLDTSDGTATQGRTNNARLGPIKIESIYPNGNGATNDFVGSDGNSTDNYLLVDEVGTPNTADYVESTTVGHRDLYEHGNLTSVGITNIFGVEVVGYASDPSGSATPLKSVARDNDGGTISTGAGSPTVTTFREVGGGPLWLDPDGVVWAEAVVNGSQFGVEVG